ncbi:MAG: glycosyltransferase, partial [Bacteroidota bacterium]
QRMQGAGATRNLGIEKAKGDYIYLLDVDDQIYPNAVNSLIKVLTDNPNIDAVFGRMKKDHRQISALSLQESDTGKVVLMEKPYWGLKWFSNLKYVVGPPAFLYRSSVFRKIGVYNEDLMLGQDTAFDIKLGMLCKVAFLDKHIYLYLKHENSTTQKVKKDRQRAFMVWPRLVKEHLPFYLTHKVPLRFKQLLFAQLYQSLGRQILFTYSIKKRIRLRAQLVSDIEMIKIPLLLKFSTIILVFFPFESLGKIYRYYVVPKLIAKLDA